MDPSGPGRHAPQVDEVKTRALAEVAAAGDARTLDEIRVRFLGRRGVLTGLLKSVGKLPADERPAAGADINAAKRAVELAIDRRGA